MNKNKKTKRSWSPPNLHVSILYGLLLLVTNIVDALQTALWYQDGIVAETNPLMAWALAINIHFFVCFKLSLVIIGIAALLYGSQRYRWAWKVLQILTLLFLCLLIYESVGHYLNATINS